MSDYLVSVKLNTDFRNEKKDVNREKLFLLVSMAKEEKNLMIVGILLGNGKE